MSEKAAVHHLSTTPLWGIERNLAALTQCEDNVTAVLFPVTNVSSLVLLKGRRRHS